MKGIATIVRIWIFTIPFFLCSCMQKPGPDEDPDCTNTIQNYYLTEAQKNILPYSGYDTINMVSNKGDTIHCIGTGRQFYKVLDLVPYANPSCGSHGTEKYYEAYRLSFIDSSKNVEIEVSHFAKILFSKPFITSEQYNTVSVNFGNETFYIGADQISNNKVQGFIGDVNINGTVFTEVGKVLKNYTDSTAYILINKSRGVLKVELITKAINWTILK